VELCLLLVFVPKRPRAAAAVRPNAKVSSPWSAAGDEALVEVDDDGSVDDSGVESGVKHLVTDHVAFRVEERAHLEQGAAAGRLELAASTRLVLALRRQQV
jgi:hypothetical protein